MFEKTHIEALFGELDREWRGKPDFEKISREAHLGIAYLGRWPSIGKNRSSGCSTDRETQAQGVISPSSAAHISIASLFFTAFRGRYASHSTTKLAPPQVVANLNCRLRGTKRL